MIFQRPIGKSKAPQRTGWLIDGINNAACIQPVTVQIARNDCHILTDCNWSSLPAQLNPWNVEHLPSSECQDRAIPHFRSRPQLYTVVIRGIKRRDYSRRSADFGIGQSRLTSAGKKPLNCGVRGTSER